MGKTCWLSNRSMHSWARQSLNFEQTGRVGISNPEMQTNRLHLFWGLVYLTGGSVNQLWVQLISVSERVWNSVCYLSVKVWGSRDGHDKGPPKLIFCLTPLYSICSAAVCRVMDTNTSVVSHTQTQICYDVVWLLLVMIQKLCCQIKEMSGTSEAPCEKKVSSSWCENGLSFWFVCLYWSVICSTVSTVQ